jgi:Holliday junction resolvasome RuvABC endonuclease subunit
MHTLGLDQSYNNSGFVIYNGEELVTFFTFKTAKAIDIYDRARQVAQIVIDTVKAHSIETVNIEGLAFGGKGDATRDLAGLIFTIITTIRNSGLKVTVNIIPPTTLKKFATGSGKSDKALMITAVPGDVLSKFLAAGYKKTTGMADLCDAYWLSQYKVAVAETGTA